jgi:hypothetical protein
VTFSIFSCFCISNQLFQAPHKAVILSEALRRSIANRGLYSAEPKDPGDARWQMLLGAFRPQTTPEDKKSQALRKPRDLRFYGPLLETQNIPLKQNSPLGRSVWTALSKLSQGRRSWVDISNSTSPLQELVQLFRITALTLCIRARL